MATSGACRQRAVWRGADRSPSARPGTWFRAGRKTACLHQRTQRFASGSRYACRRRHAAPINVSHDRLHLTRVVPRREPAAHQRRPRSLLAASRTLLHHRCRIARPSLLFDDYGQNGSLSPDGKRLLFTREGPAWWRKGYRGSQASQIWLFDLDGKSFSPSTIRGNGLPLAIVETGRQRVLLRQRSQWFFQSLGAQISTQAKANNGRISRMIPSSFRAFRAMARPLFFATCSIFIVAIPARMRRRARSTFDTIANPSRTVWSGASRKQASEAAFTADGLEIAFIAGGDVWVMDAECASHGKCKPSTRPKEGKHPLFAQDGRAAFRRRPRCTLRHLSTVPSKRGDKIAIGGNMAH